ncbi:MAG: (d)CMP kinase [Clostridiales Family XIII bacterium]|nr:(d)CMP kinase [Clostridiales Family XIII bacterium]
MKEYYQIAIDGPSGAGKSTVAKAVAGRLGAEYIDTGAMYRAVGYKMAANGIGMGDAEGLEAMLADTEIDFAHGKVMLDGIDISGGIRTEAISKMASDCSAIPAVREKLVALQRAMGDKKNVVMDGRDIGSNVFPDARFKFYLTASPEERARRRYLEMKEGGADVGYGQVLADIEARDFNDSSRELNPLAVSEDAVVIDSTDMSAAEVADRIIMIVGKGG